MVRGIRIWIRVSVNIIRLSRGGSPVRQWRRARPGDTVSHRG